MKLIKTILLATDFSKSSESVLENAIALAKVFQSQIAPIYVMPDDIQNAKAHELLKELSTQQLDRIRDSIRAAGVEVSDSILAYGDFSTRIVETARRIQANMIVIGAGEKFKGGAFLLGSNAEKIIKKSSKPVFVVKSGKDLNVSKIMCPVDFSSQSKRALENAITFAHRFNAEVVVFSVYNVSHLFSIRHRVNMDEQVELIRKEHQKELDAFLKSFNFTGIELQTEIREGDPAVEILKAIDKHRADLLLIGTTGKSGVSKILMGSVTEKVIRKVPCSFMTLKNEDIIVLEIESKLNDLESHFTDAQQLLEDGFFEEAIHEFRTCLDIDFMHYPSLKALADAYNKLGDAANEERHREMMAEVRTRMLNVKIEDDVRKMKGK